VGKTSLAASLCAWSPNKWHFEEQSCCHQRHCRSPSQSPLCLHDTISFITRQWNFVSKLYQSLYYKEVSLAHMVKEVDVQPSHPGSSLYGRRFGFLLLKKHCRASPTVFLSKKSLYYASIIRVT
jgi:hypothetical protein